MQFFAEGGKDPFRLLPLVAATFPKGTAFGGGGKVSGRAKGPILEGAVERSETGGVQEATPSGDDGRGNSPAAPAGQKQCGKPLFVSVFHTGFFSPAVCGKLPGARFQIGEKQTRKPE